MTPLQFKRKRLKIGLKTQAQAADALGITAGMVSHYEVGRRKVPKIIIRFLACLESPKIHPTA